MQGRCAAPVLAVLLVAGCGDGPTGPPPEPEPTVDRIILSPAADTATAIGDTISFEAEAVDAGGAPIEAADLRFASTRAVVASVDRQGRARAKSNGSTRIVASASGVADTARLVVDQRVALLRVEPDSVALESWGDTAILDADPEDANGRPVSDAEVSWRSTDPDVAAVDGAGRVTGREAGEARVVARTAGAEDSSRVHVVAAPSAPPVVEDARPVPLEEGASTAITGSGFSPFRHLNTVTVNGVAASVDSASRERLVVTVPGLGCLPPAPVEVEVTTSAGTGSTAFPLAAEGREVSPAAGRQTVLEGDGDFCLQFAAADARERYLVGVQSIASAPGALTPVRLRSRSAGGSGDPDAAPGDPDREAGAAPGGVVPGLPGRVARQRTLEGRLRAWTRRRLDLSAALPARSGAPGPPVPTAGIAAGGVGDTLPLRVPRFDSESPCRDFAPVDGVVRALGEHVAVLSDTANPPDGFGDADYRGFADRVDGQWSTLADYFGSPTDVDGNGRVVVLFTREVNRAGALGFFFSGDLFPRSGSGDSCPASDEGEIVYVAVPDPRGSVADTFPTDAARRILSATVPHEITHVIQRSRRSALSLPTMPSFLLEAQAMIAEEVVGHAHEGNAPGQNYGPETAFDPDGSDTGQWYRDGFTDLGRYFGFESRTSRVEEAPRRCGWRIEDPSPCIARPLWYGVGWSFLRWVSDRFGPGRAGGEENLHRAIVESDEAGRRIVEDATGVGWDTMLARWAASLWVDDRVPEADPALQQSSWNLRAVQDGLVETARLAPLEAGFSDWEEEIAVRTGSSGYLLIGGDGRSATALGIGGPGGDLPATVQVWIVRVE